MHLLGLRSTSSDEIDTVKFYDLAGFGRNYT